jgi:hypothetical protein
VVFALHQRSRSALFISALAIAVGVVACGNGSNNAGPSGGAGAPAGSTAGASGSSMAGAATTSAGSTNAGAPGAGAPNGGGPTGGGGGSAEAGAANGGATAGSGGSPSAGMGGAALGGGSNSTLGLHVNGKFLNDGDGKQILLRGPELVFRWGVYSGVTSSGVDVAWEGGSNNNVGSATIREIAKTGANALRIFGGVGNELDSVLNTAIVEQKMFVVVGRVDWTNPQMKATLQKYAKYVMIHPRGEFTHRDASLWRTEALKVVKEIRALGYTSPIEIGTTGYGQTWSTIAMYGKEVADSDPLKNIVFLLQLYSELANDVSGTMSSVAAFSSPVNVDSCLFTSTYGNTPNTYKEVWDQSLAKNLGSFYWDWWGDGEGNSMTSGGTVATLNGIGKYIANDSPAALKKTVKTPYLLNAVIP